MRPTPAVPGTLVIEDDPSPGSTAALYGGFVEYSDATGGGASVRIRLTDL